ncbi:MAG: alkaline phosphatase [Ruminococcaceae bacterium]|nr:alkaline phosphatase [Oscillospiraceae bacterium]
MMKKIVALMLALLTALTMASCKKEEKKPQAPAPVADEVKEEQVEQKVEIKNIIFLIPDGAGYGSFDFANDVKAEGGFNSQKYPNKTYTSFSAMSMKKYLAGSIMTLNCNGDITDSAAAGTALSSGYKTINQYVGVDKTGKPRATILEAAQTKGMATGLVATYEWMHATPAAFSSHVINRNDYKNIYEQIENQNIDVVLGSGYGAVSSYATIDNAVENGYTVVTTREDLESVKPGDRIWGNCTNNSSPYDINLTAEQPTLAQMTKAAITALSDDEDGFFLMVEGSKVDTGGHANDAVVVASEYLAFDAAFKVAVDFAKKRNDTVVIAAPDHDTGGLKYSEIEDIMSVVNEVRSGTDSDVIKWESGSHTAQNVGVWIYVPEGTPFIEGLNSTVGDTPETRENYVVENSTLSPYLASLLGVNLDEVSKELFVDVTDIGRYSSDSGKFSFNNGNKYVYRNSDEYYKDGEKISTNGKVAVEVAGRFYVPSEMIDEDDWNYLSEEGSSEMGGSGTADDPFIIDEAWDFIEFTERVAGGETYEGKYFLQVSDIDLTKRTDFKGAGAECQFAGMYNGNGKTISVDLVAENDECVFPEIAGTLINVHVDGKIKSENASGNAVTGGIARSVAASGEILNCSSDVEISGCNVYGIVGTNNGYVGMCYFGGTLEGTGDVFVISSNSDGGVIEKCYYSDSLSAYGQDGAEAVTTELAQTTVEILNGGRTALVAASGEDKMCLWRVSEEDGMPEMYMPAPRVTDVVVTPSSATVNRGDGLQLSAVVQGEYGPSQQVIWSLESSAGGSESVVYEDGYLYVDVNESAQSLTVMAKSATDGSVTGICTVTVGETVLSEADGTRARPYLINNEQDFLAFTNEIISGDSKSGLYYRQTKDLDMSAVPEYNGIQSTHSFNGIYDGKGYTIKVAIESESDNSLFGSCRGMIMNVRTEGTVVGTANPAGICRAVRDNGIVVNCISDCDITGGTEASGIVRSNYHLVANTFFTGKLSSPAPHLTCCVQENAEVYNNCAIETASYINGTETVYSEDDYSPETVVAKMNQGRVKASMMAGVPVSSLNEWNADGNGKLDFVK